MLKQVNFSIFICTFVQSEYKNSQNYPNHEIILRNNHTSEAEILRLMPENPETGRLTVACAPADYSASIIARAVEDVDAHLLNLNVTADSDAARVVTDLEPAELQIVLRHSEAALGRTPGSKAAGQIPIDIDIVIADGHILRPADYRTPHFQLCYAQLTQR